MNDFYNSSTAYDIYSFNDEELNGIRGTLDSVTCEYDIASMYNKVFNKYLDNPKHVPCNSRNHKAMRDINEMLDGYTITIKKFHLVQLLLEDIDSVLYSQWTNINNTNDRFIKCLRKCCVKLRRYGINDVQARAITYRINSYKERLDRIIKYVYPAYINLTPLKEYDDELKKEGSSFDDMLTDVLVLNDDLGVNDQFFNYFIEEIKKSLDSEEYIERLDAYKNIWLEKSRLEKERQEVNKQKRQKETAGRRLSKYSVQVCKDISRLSEANNIDFKRLHNLRADGHTLAKVIIATFVNSQNETVFYVTKHGDLVTRLHNAWIFTKDDSIPSNLLNRVTAGDVVISEVLFSV